MPGPSAPSDRHPLAIPVTGIFLILAVQALIVASEILIPITAAVLGYFLLNAPRRLLERIGVPPTVSAALFTLIIGTVLVVGGMALAEPVSQFVTDIPRLLEQVTATMNGPGGMLEPFSRAAKATEEAFSATSQADPVTVQVVEGGPGLTESVATLAPSLLGQFVFAIILLFFLVASGDMFLQKAVQIADRFEDKRQTVITLRTIEARLGNYLGAITLINIGLGLCIGAAMWWWGMPNPWMIGMMATVLNFVPFIGAIAGAVIAGILGFVAFGDPWAAFGVLATYYALTAFEGQLVTPALVGQRLRLNVVTVFISVAFFAWIWSVMGMVVAVPLLIVIKVVCDGIPRLRKIGLLLGDAEGFIPGESVGATFGPEREV